MQAAAPRNWRRVLSRDLVRILLLKALVLALIAVVFFPPAARITVTPHGVSARLGIADAPAPSSPAQRAEKSHD